MLVIAALHGLITEDESPHRLDAWVVCRASSDDIIDVIRARGVFADRDQVMHVDLPRALAAKKLGDSASVIIANSSLR